MRSEEEIVRGTFVALVAMLLGCTPFEFGGPGDADFIVPLIGGYELGRTSPDQIAVWPEGRWSDDTPIVAPKVVALNHDRRFIIAQRIELERPRPDVPEELVAGSESYWILDTQPPQAFGPLTHDEFERMRKELQIDAALQLKDPDEFDPRYRN